MIKKLLSCVGEYKKYAILTPIVMIGEVVMEVLIPLVMAKIIDVGIQGDGGISYTVRMGCLMIGMALLSLCFGALGGKLGAKAAMGFGKNVRAKLFYKVQDFSFANMDKFSTASLVTRLTTDVTNTQNAFMMMIRMAVRAPIMLISALILACLINARLAVVFLVAIPILGISLYLIASRAMPRFEKMLRSYDTMNASVQENLTGIRVVKAFVREPKEISKFEANADEVRRTQMQAEKLVILNMPIMQLCMYGCILAVLWFGGKMVIGGTFAIGELVFLRGSTTGGTDILGRVLLRRFQHIPLGKILLAMDFVIVTTAGFFYGTLEASLYAIISIYVVEKATDSVLYGFNESRIAYIVSDKPTEIAQRIMDETGRGVSSDRTECHISDD